MESHEESADKADDESAMKSEGADDEKTNDKGDFNVLQEVPQFLYIDITAEAPYVKYGVLRIADDKTHRFTSKTFMCGANRTLWKFVKGCG